MDIPEDIATVVDSSELDELLSSYVFSVSFDGCAGEEASAIRNWVATAILAERKRCAEVARTAIYAPDEDEEAGGDDWLQRTASNGTAARIARIIEAGA